ncbi:MAG: tyrosine-type recombinase/integrase [Pyramidobacter sp.]|nr:tyrosine-type recombinase/integrase [Pyramidobacter sp.]
MRRTDPLRTEQEVNRFLNYMADWNLTYYVACCIGINWGLRASDILALTVGDVLAGEGGRIQIRDRIQIVEQKTGKVRDIFVTAKMKDILRAHLRRLKSRPDFSLSLPLILSRQHDAQGRQRSLSRERFSRIISEAGRRTGLARGRRCIAAHSLRKTYAYQAWRSGIRVDVLQKEFGHASVETTHRYACIPYEQLDMIFKQVDFGNKRALAGA